MSKPDAPGGTASCCPICGKPAVQRFRPFCSARCAEVDLGRWFAEAYRSSARPEEELPSDDDLSG
jgi:hypothetical protein